MEAYFEARNSEENSNDFDSDNNLECYHKCINKKYEFISLVLMC